MITETFGIFTDTNLTSEFNGTFSLQHYTDFSDNPQDMQVLYVGSAAASKLMQTSLNPGVDNITLSIVDTLPEWEADIAYLEGDRVQPVGGNGYVYVCTVAGDSDSSEPTWPVPPDPFGETVVDNEVTWALVSPKHETTEVKLALSSGGLTSATGGASLPLSNTIESGTGNKIAVYIRVENAVDKVSNNIGTPDIGIRINSVIELEDV